MLWPMLAMGALGAIQGERKRAQEEKFNRSQAEMEKYSPWTGVHGSIKPVTGDWFSGALQGGTTGLMLGQQFGGGEVAPKASPLAQMGQDNAQMFDAGRFDQLKGVQDSRLAQRNPWSFS